jgi:hypothetical protein
MAFPGMPTKFIVPWTSIDPTGMNGGLPNVVGEGWVAPDINDNDKSTNYDLVGLFNDLMRNVTSVSIHPEADADALPGHSLVEECLKVTNTFFEDVADRTKTQATAMFTFQHPIPPVNQFSLYPVMYPVQNSFAMEFLHYALGTLVSLAENSRNAVHKGLDPEAAHILLNPLYTWKADVMKIWFNYEVEGEISIKELAEAISTVRPRRVLSTPDETDERPSLETVNEILKGANVLNWVPDKSDWVLFSDIRMSRYSPERIRQPELSRAVTEDALPESGVDQAGNPIISHGTPPTV